MSDSTIRTATYEDLMRVPEHLVAEIIDGVLYSAPQPAFRHSKTAFRLSSHLGGPFDLGSGGPGGWSFLFEPELHLGEDVVVPDIAGWRRERMSEIPDVAFTALAPDWVCEILSPSTYKLDRIRKRRIYAREEVAYLWLVDPIVHMLEVFRLEGGKWKCVADYADDEVVRAEPFDAVEISLATLWIKSQA